jgi:hypothetical protein
MANILTDPPFAANPPVKLNVNAKILGLVIGILALIGAVFGGLIGGLLSLFSLAAGGFGGIWLIGILIGLVADIIGAIGGFQMYSMNRAGKRLVIYALALAFLGAIVGAIGNIVAYSGIYTLGGYSAGGAIFGLIFGVIVYGIVWYIVVISRWPGDVPLVATPNVGGYGNPPGGYGSPPPPPPPSA